MRHAQTGLSLLEMLVVLSIAGIALLLASQSLWQYQRAQSSAIYSERAGREYRLTEAWFRTAVRALHPVEDAPFAGDESGFRGLTLAPVLAGQGVPVVQEWRATDGPEAADGPLLLTEEGRRLPLVLRGAERVRFMYVDAEGRLQRQWPPALGIARHLPEAIVMVLEDGSGTASGVLYASIAGPREPLWLPFETDPDW